MNVSSVAMEDEDLIKMRAQAHTRASEWMMVESFANLHSSAVIIMTEGQDDAAYYKIQVEKALKKLNINVEIVVRPAENGNTYFTEVLSKLRKESPVYPRMLFFFDREYPSQKKYAADIYLTRYHSVENYYTSSEVFIRMLGKLPLVNSYPEVASVAEHVFMDNRNVFVDEYSKIGLFTDILIEKNISPNIKHVDLTQYFGFNKNGEVQVKSPGSFEILLSNLLSKKAKQLGTVTNGRRLSVLNDYLSGLKEMEQFSKSEKLRYIRGKQDLKFFNLQIDNIKNAEKQKKLELVDTPIDYQRNSGKNGMLSSLQPVSNIGSVSEFADPDENIVEYVRRRLKR